AVVVTAEREARATSTVTGGPTGNSARRELTPKRPQNAGFLSDPGAPIPEAAMAEYGCAHPIAFLRDSCSCSIFQAFRAGSPARLEVSGVTLQGRAPAEDISSRII